MASQADSTRNVKALYGRFERRNRIVGFLRLAVPLSGILLAAGLIIQIVLSNWANDFGLNAISFDRNQVIVGGPRYSGLMSDGTRYEIVAKEARTQLKATDVINLKTATITIRQKTGFEIVASAPEAQLRLNEQKVIVNSLMRTRDSNQVSGQFTNSVIDWPAQTLTTTGPVRLEFKDGAVLEAQSLVYSAKTGEWDFAGVRYTLAGDKLVQQ